MARMKDFRTFIAEDFVTKSGGLIDIDKAFVMADELWDKAAHKNKKATIKLGKLVEKYKRELA